MANKTPFTTEQWNFLRTWRRGGPQGQPGTTGPSGPQGVTGPQGSDGPQGAAGPQGTTGVQGPAGSTGAQGNAGAQGAAGPQGSTGAQGATGSTGSTGPQGSTGAQGASGAQGPQGNAGAQGSQGSVGSTGAQGAQGFQGSAGSTGAQGAAGATGAQGSQGSQGATGVPVVRGRTVNAGTTDYTVPGVALTATSTIGFAANTLVYEFVLIETDITIDQIAVNVTTGPVSNANIRLGIYAADTSWQPSGAPIVEQGIAVASGFTGIKTTSAFTQALAAGRYLLTTNGDVGLTVRTWRGWLAIGAVAVGMGTNTMISGGAVSSAYAALPSTPVPWTTARVVGDHGIVVRVSVP